MKFNIKQRNAKEFRYYDGALASWFFSWWEHEDVFWANGWFVLDICNKFKANSVFWDSCWEVETEGEDTGSICYYPLDPGCYVRINVKKYRKKVA